jgi:outer membrane protein assembly factor BamB
VYAAGSQFVGNYNYGSGDIAGTAGNTNPVLVKYDSSGTAQWAKTITAGTTFAQFNTVTVDASGNVYAAGSQLGTENYNYGSGNIAGTADYLNPVLVKYDSSGTAQWAKTITGGGPSSASFNGVTVDTSGNVYAAGYQTSGDYNYGTGNIAGTSSVGNPVLVKYNSSGTAQWAKTITAGRGDAWFYAVTADATGNVYAAGYQKGTENYNYGSGNIAGTSSEANPVLVKYSK